MSSAITRACAAAAIAIAMTCSAGAARAYCLDQSCPDGPCAKDAQGCPTGGSPIQWPTRCVGYSIHPHIQALPLDDVRAAIGAAFATWSSVDCPGEGPPSIELVPIDDVECGQPEYNPGAGNANAVIFVEDEWDHQGAGSVLQLTTVTTDSATSVVVDADLEINFAQNTFTLDGSGFDLQSIATHAAGRMLGLANSQDPDATMAPDYVPGTIDLRTLSADDVAGICTLYPLDRDAPCDTAPRGGFSPVCGGSASAGDPPGDEDSAEEDREVGGCGCRMGSKSASSSWQWMAIAVSLACVRRGRLPLLFRCAGRRSSLIRPRSG